MLVKSAYGQLLRLPHIAVTIILQMRHLLYSKLEVLDTLRVLALL